VEEVGTVTLTRRTYRVFRDGDEYVVRSQPREGHVFEERIPSALADTVALQLHGKSVHKEEAAEVAAAFDKRLVPDGYSRDFYGQAVLVVLTALRRARARQEGRAWVYDL
jgi:hypothetical protein